VDVARPLGPRVYAQALHAMGNLHFEMGDLVEARRLYEITRLLYLEDADPRSTAAAAISLAAVAQEQGRYDDAHTLATEALERFGGAGDPRQVALALASLGSVAVARGDLVEARDCLRACVRIYQQLGDASSVAMVLERLIALVIAQGQWDNAIRLAGAAAALRALTGSPLPQSGQAKLERLLEPARRALGDADVERIWQEGRVFDVDQAIAVAFTLTEPAPAAPAHHDARTERGAAASVLTRREREVATLIARGLTNRQIAEQLVITEGTTASHVVHILNKLGYSSRAQVAAWAVGTGLVAGADQH
jgi:DNA-binding CsgD family transcriptional regulator